MRQIASAEDELDALVNGAREKCSGARTAWIVYTAVPDGQGCGEGEIGSV